MSNIKCQFCFQKLLRLSNQDFWWACQSCFNKYNIYVHYFTDGNKKCYYFTFIYQNTVKRLSFMPEAVYIYLFTENIKDIEWSFDNLYKGSNQFNFERANRYEIPKSLQKYLQLDNLIQTLDKILPLI